MGRALALTIREYAVGDDLSVVRARTGRQLHLEHPHGEISGDADDRAISILLRRNCFVRVPVEDSERFYVSF
ncbi:hypothetical protein ACFQMM_02325 [Saliphagus sp. GCM10025308]